MNPLTEKLAKLFHAYYELLAPECGYTTRWESAVPWEAVPDINKRVMRYTIGAVLDHLEREANFKDGEEVVVVISIPGTDGVFAQKGERGRLSIREADFQVAFPGERWWTTIDRHELALHCASVVDNS